MRRFFLPIFSLLTSCVAFAGGDHVAGYVTEFLGSEGIYVFNFKQTEPKPLIRGCTEFKVHVKYQRVPWYSWLPFISSSHPTREQTIEASAVLQEAARNKREILFGYMGHGLVSADSSCTFFSKGLLVYSGAIISFNQPV
ncbi:MAG: hypothetical protein Q4G39_08855 [Brachymonas sp.]|nr:hypothetical protein [Brachymonas sp.]